MTAPIVVATVLVSNNQAGLDHVLLRLSQQSTLPQSVVVIDNASRQPSTAALTLGGSDVPIDLVRLSTNLGVGGGHNAAIRRALDAHAADTVLVLEHDTFPDDRCFEELMRCAAGSHGPCVVVTTLVRNNYERRWLEADQNLPSVARPRRLRLRRASAAPRVQASASVRFTLNGVLIPREVVETVGGLREDFFVGQEDWDYSARVQAAGYPIVGCPNAIAVHANKGAHRFSGFLSPGRLYYYERNLVASANTNTIRSIRLAAVGTLKALAELFTRGRGWRFAAARVYATRDGLRHQLGPKSYGFMTR